MHKVLEQFRLIFADMISVFETRQKFIEFLKTMALVVPLTLLIWYSAEREQWIETATPTKITLSLQTSDSKQYAQFTDDNQVSIQLSGPNAKIKELRDFLQNAGNQVTISLPDNQANGKDSIAIVDKLNANSIFQGVTIMSADPPKKNLIVEPIIERNNVPIILQRIDSGSERLTITPEHVVTDPYQVTVRGPKSIIESLFSAAGSGVVTDLRLPNDITTPGTKTFEKVNLNVDSTKLEPGQREHVTIIPSQLNTLKFDIAAEQNEVVSLSLVPIVYPKYVQFDDAYVVSTDPKVLQNVRIKGPPAIVRKLNEAIQPGSTAKRIVAELPLTFEDFTNGNILGKPQRRVPTINLPPGVTLESQLDPIEFTISPRTSGN